MKQYLITAYDYTDPEAIERRMKARPIHLQQVSDLKRSGNHVLGGAILNDEGKTIGSTMVLQFETEEEMERWRKAEVYVIDRVWESVDIKPFRVAEIP